MAMAVLIPVGVLLLFLIFIYNSLISKKNEVTNAFAGIDVQLKKRYDLIPNLITAVKKYMEHEKSTLEELTKLRTQALSGDLSDEEKVNINNKINHALSGLKVAVENYPDLKADSSFDNLMRSLNEVESQLSAARRTYNSAVTIFNNALEMFPSNIIAAMMGLTRKEVFEAQEVERKNVKLADHF